MSRAWMPFYIGDYLRDTLHLSTEEHGAYLLLIFAAWDRGNRLPEADLAAITRATPRRWAAMRDRLAALFSVEDGIWMHRRVQRELDAATRRSDSARGSANARWSHMRDGCDGNANASKTHGDPQCYSQSQSQREPNGATSAPSPEADLYRRGKEILGRASGGLIKKLLAAKGGNVPNARAALETASQKGDAAAYLGGVIRGEAERTRSGGWDGSFN